MHMEPGATRIFDGAIGRAAVHDDNLVHPLPANLGNDDPNGVDLVEGWQQQRCGELHSAPVSTETFLRYQSYVSCNPSGIVTLACQPRRAARRTSISFFGIPSGLLSLNTISPG